MLKALREQIGGRRDGVRSFGELKKGCGVVVGMFGEPKKAGGVVV